MSRDLTTLELLMSSVPATVDPKSTIRPELIEKVHGEGHFTASEADAATARSRVDAKDKPTLVGAPPDLVDALARLPSLSLGGDTALLEKVNREGGKVFPVGVAADLSVHSILGEGGMGVVYAAEQRSLSRDVALKVLKGSGKPRELSALLHEARLMGSLEHPGIVPVHALGADATGRPVLVMKRIEGTSWQDVLDDPAHPAWESLAPDPDDRLSAHLDILQQVATTVAFAHSRGVLHRDIKPANVMIGSFGEVYVADWGVALELEVRAKSTSPVGTPAFMAPEMALGNGAQQDERTDVYLLGSTLHFVLMGTPRHRGPTLRDVLFSAAESKPFDYPDSVPPALADLANRATSLSLDDRPATALEFRDGIDEYLKHRASLRLSQRALESLTRADALTDTSSAEAGRDQRNLLIEARFGFSEAIREWAHNTQALEGRERALEAAVRLEVADRAIRPARAYLGEMKSPSAALRAEVDALGEALAEEERERDEARALARDHDPGVARRKRTIFLAILAVAGIGITLGMRHSRLHGTGAPVPHTIVLPAALALVLSPIAWWLREDLGKSAVNRRFLGIIYVVFGASTALRALAYIYQTNIDQMMTFELLLIATATATLGVTFSRNFFWVSAGAIVCAFLAQQFQDWLEAFYVPPFLALVALSTLTKSSASTAKTASGAPPSKASTPEKPTR